MTRECPSLFSQAMNMRHLAADDVQSDDSDFYGDDGTKTYLRERVHEFDTDAWISEHRLQSGYPLKQDTFRRDTSNLHNPYEGVSFAWQLSEAVDDFLDRLPPQTTTTASVPWIFICNPYIPRVRKSEARNQSSKGNEDEGTEEPGNRLDILCEGGTERLHIMSNFMDGLKGQKSILVQTDLAKERTRAVSDILNLAHAAKVRAGKWMLFIPPREVNNIWGIVARAVANNELGIAAKVAPEDEEDRYKDRLICVYTQDFRDEVDVRRVLRRLRELRLVEAKKRPIYYKPAELCEYLHRPV